jgi:hypothetical protein
MLSRRSLLLSPALTLSAQPRKFLRSYFFLNPEAKLKIVDLTFGSDQRGWALGIVLGQNDRPKGVLLTTTNAGVQWALTDLKFLPQSLFALNDSALWAVSVNGEIWSSAEGGRDWRKLSKKSEALRVAFLDDRRGFLIGIRKTFMRTEDGGKTWRHVPEGAQVSGNADNFLYRCIEFWNGRIGLVAGNVEPEEPRRRRRDPDLPDFMEPETSSLKSMTPRVIATLESTDSGASWRKQEVSGFGFVQRIVLGADGTGLNLMKFRKSFPFGGELYSFYPKLNRKGELLLRYKDLELHDVAYIPGIGAYVACTERLGGLPVPTKVSILFSSNLTDWEKLPVDYRAVAEKITLAVTPSAGVFAALDTGTILALR